MIVDITGIELTPGNCGRDCAGNGEHFDNEGNIMECCCDECNYMMCCMEEHNAKECLSCEDDECPYAV